MDRSLFPEGVEVHEVNMTREGRAKAAAILRRHLDTSTMGVVRGLNLSVASHPLKVKVSPGIGYTPLGELIEVGVTVDNVPLHVYDPGTVNYIVAVYTEAYSDPQAHEDLGVTFNTYASGSYRIRAYSEAAFNALPSTDPDLNTDAMDRIVVLGTVTAQGAATDLTDGDMFSTGGYGSILAISQPTNITGIQITRRSAALPLGTGTLTYVPVPNPTLSWQAPGDGVAGVSVSLVNDGLYVLDSYSAGMSISVYVLLGKLPETDSTVTDILTITDLYTQTVALFTARDEQHRHMIGSGTPTVRNPHGITADDIGLTNADTEGAIVLHRRAQHPAMLGIHNAPNAGRISIDGSGSPDVIIAGQFGENDYAFVDGKVVQSINGVPLQLPNVEANVSPGLYEIHIDSTGKLGASRRIAMNGGGIGGISEIASFIQVVYMPDEWIGYPGNVNIVYDYAANTILFNGYTLLQVGSTPRVERVYLEASRKLWMEVYIYPADRLGSSRSETWVAYDPVDPTRTTHLPLAMVYYTGSATGFMGYGGIGGVLSTGSPVDMRYAYFESGKSTAPGVKVGVDAVSKKGYLRLSKEGKSDIILDYDVAEELLQPDQVVSFQNADADTTGLLTFTDWNTFNNKQNALGFTPVRQGHPSYGSNQINIAWDGQHPRLTVDIDGFDAQLASRAELTTHYTQLVQYALAKRYGRWHDPGIKISAWGEYNGYEGGFSGVRYGWTGTPTYSVSYPNTNPSGYALLTQDMDWSVYVPYAPQNGRVNYGCGLYQGSGQPTTYNVSLHGYHVDTGTYYTLHNGPNTPVAGWSGYDHDIEGTFTFPLTGWWRFVFYISANHWATNWSGPRVEFWLGL